MSDELVKWLRRRIEERRYLAQHAIELGSAATWTELSSGVLMTCDPDAPQESLDGLHPLGDSSLTRLMEANDPRDTIARCEAELAMLDFCLGFDEADHWAASMMLALLGSGYQHRDGYREEWKP